MSQRGKRQTSRLDDGLVTSKRRKVRCMAMAEEEEASVDIWTPRPNSDLKISSIYNRSSSEAPAELFRKDLISAMKLPDSEPLSADEYWVITDQWKQEWEKGVQVPVNPDSLPGSSVTVVTQAFPSSRLHHEFKLPKSKYIKITKCENFKSDEHFLSPIPCKAEKVCSYDLDNCDNAWLKIANGERATMGLPPIREDQLERVIEELELRCWDKVQTILKSEEGLGIEYDENVICDVCRSPDSEESNEMVFCDSCNICVHQACYGITTIPSGSWLCRTCAIGQRPECVLCPNKGGAMKCTRSGHKWAHVSCALWIPEVSIGCVEKMEPITKISSIPQSRWALICVLCRERVGACIQCSVKTCKVAYHVTCAFKHGLEMKAIIENENAEDGVKLRSYCEKHSVAKKDQSGSTSEDDECKRKKRKDMTSEEKNQARAAKLQEIEGKFEKHVSAHEVSGHHDVDLEGLVYIYNYWVLKRRSNCNKPLLAPRSDDVDFLTRQQEQADLEKMRMFVQLRRDLERVRNLCYMVSRREKLSRTFFRMREQTFHKQIAVLSEPSCSLSSAEITAVKEANHGPSIYDKLYSHTAASELSTDFETALARIAGVSSPTLEDKNKIDRNGMRKKPENPYKRMYVNGGLERRRSVYTSMSSGSEMDIKRPLRLDLDSTDDKKNKSKKLKKRPISRITVDTSTEDEEKPKVPWASPRSKSLRQMEKELAERTGTDDSDDLIPFTNVKKDSRSASNIYSDSDSDTSLKDERNEQRLRTKAALKEFTALAHKNKKSNKKSPSKNKERNIDSSMEDEYYRDKENVNLSKQKSKDPTTDLIVPQRQAAKKATESIRSTHVKKSELILSEQEAIKTMSSNEESKLSKPNKSVKLKGSKELSVKENKLLMDDKSKLSNDIYEFDKDLCSDQDILAYVPQRQAAKKAAEHIKSGLHKPVSNEQESDPSARSKINDLSKAKKDEKIKKDQEIERSRRTIRPQDIKKTDTSKSSSSSTSSSSSSSSGSSSSSSSSSSESAEEEEEDKKKGSAKHILVQKNLSNPPANLKVDKKGKQTDNKALSKNAEMPSLVDRDKQVKKDSSPSSSSDSEDNSVPKQVKKGDIVKKSETFTKYSDSHRQDDSSSKVVADKKLSKTPEKKLKTSDGRPELKFQQPPTQREESSREKGGRRGKSSVSTTEKPEISQTTKPPSNANKIESSVKESSNRKAHPSRKEDETTAKDSSQGRKRKSDDFEKQSITETHSSVKKSDVTSFIPVEEKRQSQELSTTSSKKADKVVESSPKKNENLSFTSTLEREMAERKAGRESGSRSNSKKSLDRLFEKRDKLVKENEKKEQIKTTVSQVGKPIEKSKSPEKHKTKSPEKHLKKEHLEGEEISIKVEDVPEETIKDCISVEQANLDNQKNFQRSLFSPYPEEIVASNTTQITEKPSKLGNDSQLANNDLNLKSGLSKDSLPILIPQVDTSFKHIQETSLPHLEKIDNVNENINFPSVISESDELKKVTSKANSSLATPYHQRSIFSPQPPSKDSTVAELFDFENDILAVDETVNDDGFSMSRDSEEMRSHPLMFSFNSDFLFKIDSKEDSARETLNLVEKLRLDYAKKSHTESSDVEVVEQKPQIALQEVLQQPSQKHLCSEILQEQKLAENPKLETIVNFHEIDNEGLHSPLVPVEIKADPQIETKEPDKDEIGVLKPVDTSRVTDDQHLLQGVGIDKQIPQYDSSERFQYQSYGMPIDVGKVPGREKLDRSNSAQADERWVPPSSVPPSVHSYDPMPSPYRNKWADSEIMPSRHSSSSSSASSTSSLSHREELEQTKPEDVTQQPPNSIISELLPFQGLHPSVAYNPSCAISTGAAFHFADNSGFPVGPLYKPTFTAPTPGIYASNFSSSYPNHQQQIKPTEEPPLHMPPPCSAAFTASSHNMALTAAMVSPISQLVPETSQLNIQFPAESTQQNVQDSHVEPPENYNHMPHVEYKPNTIPPSEEPSSVLKTVGKKSPSKPTRTSARCIAQQAKSPGKSPGKSPKQLLDIKKIKEGSTSKRGRPPGRGNLRGRGRGKGRGRGHGHSDPNTIHSKLVGTVYDFDIDEDEEGGDSLENLRAMRERRKSSDVHDKKDVAIPIKEPSVSPKFVSSSTVKSRSYSDIRETDATFSPLPRRSKEAVDENQPIIENSRLEFVQPVLQAPVNVSSYSSFESTTTSTIPGYQNHIMESYQSTNNESLKDFMEELEEEIKTLKSSTVPKIEAPVASTVPEEVKQPSADSRNQLKVKIKGPFLDANYVTSAVVTQASVVNVISSSQAETPATTSTVAASLSTGSNLRRMRKKELLRQYWTQDMNMDESISITPIVPIQDPLINRNVITIPKAVASMTTIPTREDYKAVVDANMEKKRKKEKSLVEGSDVERRRSVGSNASNESSQNTTKRRGKTAKASSTSAPSSVTPKLKIKLGSSGDSASVTTFSEDKKNLRERPPKKRLSGVPKPTVEELKRESMKFRKMVMADFDEEEKTLESGNRKRKKRGNNNNVSKSCDMVRVITDDAAPKLIIRFGRRNEDTVQSNSLEPSVEVKHSPNDERTSECSALRKVRTSKTSPIRLKLSRCEKGYVMKKSSDSVSIESSEVLQDTDSQPERPPPPPLPLSKDCEVR
ncbi:PHD finger protein rhinoceros [Cimex lectularius]|uniref:PHD finger protein rhinoceros n=1 Tax=Cimex lectularius TaxID=79782 RepID=A0A8I6R984_CIMLE|nr:PHD finger protein rhinoceros [Cimex lectularius]XP_014241592.1 PHD finger protein rhinoceros [Cimex lectularius]XP_024080553.1 PHD finger protein rhinoceros [Cimex lectularius]